MTNETIGEKVKYNIGDTVKAEAININDHYCKECDSYLSRGVKRKNTSAKIYMIVVTKRITGEGEWVSQITYYADVSDEMKKDGWDCSWYETEEFEMGEFND